MKHEMTHKNGEINMDLVNAVKFDKKNVIYLDTSDDEMNSQAKDDDVLEASD